MSSHCWFSNQDILRSARNSTVGSYFLQHVFTVSFCIQHSVMQTRFDNEKNCSGVCMLCFVFVSCTCCSAVEQI